MCSEIHWICILDAAFKVVPVMPLFLSILRKPKLIS